MRLAAWCSAAVILALGLQMPVRAQKITGVGHATMTVRDNKVTFVEWNTEPGTAAARSGFYDNGTNSWCDFWYYSFEYPSLSATGEEVTLSALAALPDNNAKATELNNVIVGCHITMTSDMQCPTEYINYGSMLSDVFVLMSHAGDGLGIKADPGNQCYYNLVILPDYEGYGVSCDRTHPYLCEEITARQVVDAVRYGIELYNTDERIASVRRPFRDGWRTICEGYSQGGAVALATQRYIEQHGLVDELQLAGSVCGGGPYDPMATFLYYMERDQAGEALSLPLVLPFMLKGLCDCDPYMAGHDVSEYVEERLLETGIIGWLEAKNKTSDEITAEWKALYQNGKDGDPTYFRSVLTSDGRAMLRNAMKPEVYNYFKMLLERNPDYAIAGITLPQQRGVAEDLHLALESNNILRDWIPEHTICLYHSSKDDVVPYQNCSRAMAVFGNRAKFYASARNGGHTAAGTEFFTGSAREEAINMLAGLPIHPDDDITAVELEVKDGESGMGENIQSRFPASQSIYDLQGRKVGGTPGRGIYVKDGRKIAVGH